MKDCLQHKGYSGTVQFSTDEKVFFGKLEGINDLVTFEGNNVRALENSFIDAVEDYLETCKKLGKEPEKAV